MTWWAVALGAAFGAPCRYLLDIAVTRRFGQDQPWGIMVVNLLGSTFLGALAGWSSRGALPVLTYGLLGVGLCGSFTTFSAFVWQTTALFEAGRARTALVNVCLSLGLGIFFAYGAYLLTAAGGLFG